MSPLAVAELEPISDAEMSEVQGQALMTVDNAGDGTHNFTRVTMGMDVKTRLNVDDAVMGGDDAGADLAVSDLALGHYAEDPNRVQIDGQTYAAGEVVRFQGAQPYFELAKRDGELSGFRMGFGEARGTLSGDFASFSGNLGIKLTQEDGTQVDATLFDESGIATKRRATQIGIPGADGTCSSPDQCVALTNIKSMNVGVDNGDGTVGFTNDLFMAFQQESVNWQQVNGAGVIQGPEGVFMNLPTSMNLDMQTLQNGVQRERTHRGTGMF
ncbi:hypothetical protein E5Q11_06335 [Marinobacter confluentis]|uniref:Uncharacterized protein n=1 Tax=Marinobacter confluentis TaxID=1697557 RepID=A0A4Z1BTW9_9GAMM|nr:hypothetical protein E5Q11_06335 [Marinobacter confluentis]